MTEQEWLDSTEPEAMLNFLQKLQLFSKRKQRLFAVACCRRVWSLLTDERSRTAVEVAEKFADGLVTGSALVAARKRVRDVAKLEGGGGHLLAYAIRMTAADDVLVIQVAWNTPPDDWPATEKNTQRKHEQSVLLRDIVGLHPFQPIAIEPSWQTSTVTALARGIYEEKVFDRLILVADALMDSGCDNDEILDHCRLPAEHVRGCWVVDGLLGLS